MANSVPQTHEAAAAAALVFARLIGLLTTVFGAAVLIGWRLEEPLLVQGFPTSLTMTPNAAAGFVLAGVGLLALTFRMAVPLARLLGLLLIFGAGATLSQDIAGHDLGIDQLLFTVPRDVADRAWPGRMSPGAALALVLIGCVLVTTARQGWLLIAATECMLVAILVLAITNLIGHSYEITQLYNPFPFTAMPIHMGIMLALAAAGLSAACPDRGFAKSVLDPSAGGQMMRRLLPGIVIVPVLLGWIVHRGLIREVYSDAAGTALFAVSTIVIMTFFIWLTSVALRNSDQERQDALIELHRQRESLRTTLVSIADAVIATNHRGEVALMNGAAEALTGWALAKARGRPLPEIFRIADEKTGEPLGDPTAKALQDNEIVGLVECSLIRDDGSKLPIEHTTAPILNQKGRAGGAVLIFRDVTDRRRAEDQQRMMVGELNHRVRNVLMIVQSLVHASAQHTGHKSAEEMSKTLTDRVQSLSRAHELLLNTHWTGASFKQMVEMELAPYREDNPRKLTVRGRDVLLSPQCTSVVAMALHELATNAAKYGALSRPEGELSVKWTTRRSVLTVNWVERNIEVRDGRSSGFGMRLIDRGIRQNLGGDATLDFHDDTLAVTMTIPLEDGVQVKPPGAIQQSAS